MTQSGRQLFREWLDGLDRKLAADAARASLAGHPGMTGDQREQVFRSALREFLPPSLHVGTGKVFSIDEEPSRQVDVVIFDGRFPVLRQGESALYPIEGVIATIEVKSLLTDEELHRALDNCHSVMTQNPSFAKEDADRIHAIHVAAGKSELQAKGEVVWALTPRTYVFAFDGLRTTDALTDSLTRWLKRGCRGTVDRPFIPSVIATGGCLGIAWGDPIQIRAANPSAPQPRDEDVVMTSFRTESRLGVLASHLLWHIEKRTTLTEHSTPIRRAMRGYLPFAEYIDGVIRDGPYSLTVWKDRPPADEPAEATATARVPRSGQPRGPVG